MQGLTLEKYLELTNKELAEMREEQRAEAENVLKELVLDAIITKEGITAADEELDERINKFAESYGQNAETIRNYFAAQGSWMSSARDTIPQSN